MILLRFRKTEEWLWAFLLACQLITLLFFTPLQSTDYSVFFFLAANVLSWPTSLLLLLYYRRGRMSDQESQTSHLISGIFGLLVGAVAMGFWLGLVVVWLGGLVLFGVVLFLSGRKLLKERKQKVLDRTENEKK